jgi:stage II sporulation protein M
MIATLFIFSCIFGFCFARSDPSAAKEGVEMIFSEFSFIKEIPLIFIFFLIFLNNSIKALIATVAGFFFGLFPLFFVSFNGYVIGLVIYVKGLEVGFVKAILYLLPHGVLEVPAILLASSYGLWLGRQFYKKLMGEQKQISMKKSFSMAIRMCFRIVFPILLIAAVIETFITPLVIFYF